MHRQHTSNFENPAATRRAVHTEAPMTSPVPDTAPVNDALRRLHRSAVVSLALCALAIGIATFLRSDTPADDVRPLYSWVALALAGTAILTRRSGARPSGSLRVFVYGSLLSMVAAAGLGILGMLVAVRESQTTVGLLYTLAGALLVLRPPAVLGSSAEAGS